MNVRYFLALAVVAGASTALARTATRQHPLAAAKAGEWAMHKTTIRSGESSSSTGAYGWIDKVEDRRVHLKSQTLDEDAETPITRASTLVVELEKLPDEEKPARVSEEAILVKGKKLACKKLEFTRVNEGKAAIHRWVSTDVPIHGLVREVILDREGREAARIELLDFGATGGTEKPIVEKALEKLPAEPKPAEPRLAPKPKTDPAEPRRD